jgi:ABC-2 type transport system ATP-binding protein
VRCLIDVNYAIETVNLVKRYPTTSRKHSAGDVAQRHAAPNTVVGINTIIDAVKGSKGPFIEALKGIDLRIREGEIFGILGPNGAGKTTLIKILCTLVIHDEGEVYINGFDPKRESNEVLKNLQAVLPESRGFNWRLTGRQNLEFYALLYGLDNAEAKKRTKYLLEVTNLTDRADDGYQRYSTGMQRKLLLCRALLRNTPIILFDEPTAGLDPVAADEFRRMIDKLVKDEGKTILTSTHNLQEAQELCDRLAILERGTVIALDTPDNLRHLVIEDRFLRIVFADAVLGAKEEKLVRDLEKIEGTRSISAEVNKEKRFDSLRIRVEKDRDLSGILRLLAESGLKINVVDTAEPTLEDAFKAITNQNGRFAHNRVERGDSP